MDEKEKKDENIIKKIGYVIKKFGAGIVSGTSGIGQSVLTEIDNEAEKGKEKSSKEIFTEYLQNAANMSTPTGNMSEIKEAIEENIETIKDENKNLEEKATTILTNNVTHAIDMSVPGKKMFDSYAQATGKYAPQAHTAVKEASQAISETVQNMQESLNQEGQNYDATTQIAGEVGQVIGNMAPSVAATAITKDPAMAMAAMGLSSKGQSTQEALQRGAELDEAIKIGNTKATVEIGTEMLFGGVNIFGKGAIDDIVTKGIKDKVKNETIQRLAERGIQVSGEVLEETLSDIMNTLIDKGTIDPNAKYTLKDFSETALVTILSNGVINGITRGIEENINNKENIQNKSTEIKQQTEPNGKIKQITKTPNKLIVECEGFFANFDKILEKYGEQGYLKDNISVIFDDYENVVLPLKTVETMREKMKEYTSHISHDDDQITKFVKSILSIKKNIQYAHNKTGDKNIGASRNFEEGLLQGKCVCSGFANITKMFLEAQGIESRVALSEEHEWNQVKLGDKWYNFDTTFTKTDLAQNIGKYLTSDEQIKNKKEYKNRESFNQEIIPCTEVPSKELLKSIKQIVKENKKNIPTVDFGKKNLMEKIVQFFKNRQESNLALPTESTNTQLTDVGERKTNSKVTQITETENKLYIEYEGIFRNLEKFKVDLGKINQKYSTKGFIKEDMDLILRDYDGERFSLNTMEAMLGNLRELTSNVEIDSGDLDKIVNITSSIRNNIKVNDKWNTLGKSSDLEKGLLEGKTTTKGFENITRAALELHGIESREVKIGGKTYKQVKIDEKWYSLDSIIAEANLQKASQTKEQLPREMSKRIHEIVKENKASIPNLNYQNGNTILERAKSIFNKTEENSTPAVEQQVINNKIDMKITDYSPAGMINDKILWEIQTWDQSNVNNKISTAYVLLENMGTPQDIFAQSPEKFREIYNTLLKENKGQNGQFLGSIEYMKDTDSWTACLSESKEMQNISKDITTLIEQKKQLNEKIKEFENLYQNIEHETQKQPIAENTKLQPQVSLEETQRGNNPQGETRYVDSQKVNAKQDTIVISDLHSRMDRWELVKQEIKQNPNLNVIILGDAMDRGEYGVEMLLQMKELSDVGRVKYLPGNHDEFAYNYLRGKVDGNTQDNLLYIYGAGNMEHNGGKATIKKLDNFDQTVNNALREGLITKEITLEELTDWLGNQPLQMTAEQDGNSYALAHALFDSKLYGYDKNFNLQKAYDMQMNGKNAKNSEVISRFKNTIWYRVETKDTHYAPISWPERYAMIVGHTSQKQRS